MSLHRVYRLALLEKADADLASVEESIRKCITTLGQDWFKITFAYPIARMRSEIQTEIEFLKDVEDAIQNLEV